MAVLVGDERLAVGLAAVRVSERALASLVGALEPTDVSLSDASPLWKAFDRIERLAANAKTLLAARVEESGAWRRDGARSPGEHLARMAGTTVSAARRSLETSRLLGDLPAVTDALHRGVVSTLQADAIAIAASADPAAEERLLQLADETSLAELREECLRTRAAADPDPDGTNRRIRNARTCRTYTDAEGAWHLAARGTVERGAAFEAALAPIIDALFGQARVDGRFEAREAYAFDALMTLAELHEERDQPPTEERTTEPNAEPTTGPTGEPTAEPTTERKRRRMNPRFLAILQVGLEALTRGAIDGEEMCEIVGVGPVPVRVARDLLGESILKLVITRGVDVATVVHLGRGPTAAQRIALLWTKPKCAVAGCSSRFVQIDHRVPWAATHHTTLAELDPLCPHHHKLKTNENWSLVEGKERRAFVGPDDYRHPRSKPPPGGL